MQKHKLVTGKKFTKTEVRETIYRVQHRETRNGPVTGCAFFSSVCYTNFSAPSYEVFHPLITGTKKETLCWFREHAFLARLHEIKYHLEQDQSFELVTATLIRKPFYEDNVQVVF